MKNYDEFILHVGQCPSVPQDIYARVKFRVAVANLAVPASVCAVFLTVFLGFFVWGERMRGDEYDVDLFAQTEETVFAGEEFYSLLDDY